MNQKPQIAFVLGLVGAIFSLGMGVMMGGMMAFAFGVSPGSMGAMEMTIVSALLGWFTLVPLVGGVVMLVGALRVRKATAFAEQRSAGVWMIAGGVVTLLGGNVIAAGLGIGGGALLLVDPPATAA